MKYDLLKYYTYLFLMFLSSSPVDKSKKKMAMWKQTKNELIECTAKYDNSWNGLSVLERVISQTIQKIYWCYFGVNSNSIQKCCCYFFYGFLFALSLRVLSAA